MNKKNSTKQTGNKNSTLKMNAKPVFNFAFERTNYIIMLVGIVFIIIGYVLLTGGGSDNPDIFNEDLFNFRRLVLSPVLIVAGFVIEIYAILKKTKKNEE
ncbi:MAG: DUF3098 domain-containing protein [Bacteroidales bacterium]|jgi:membrane-bound ClpP family serine protease|nr:DUF3098 domain-containing protein [Bacteroidales bacterium]